jgi:hypothetical protein
MKQIQTSYIAGLEVTVTGEIKVTVSLRAENARRLLKLSQKLGKPMTTIVAEAVNNYNTEGGQNE